MSKCLLKILDKETEEKKREREKFTYAYLGSVCYGLNKSDFVIK